MLIFCLNFPIIFLDMKINHQPLKLEFLAHLTIIIHTSQQTSEGNNIIDRKLLEIGLPWPALEEHLFLRRCCVYAFRYFINKKPQDILEHLISNCLRFNPDGGLSLLKLLSPYISQIDTAITNVQNITSQAVAQRSFSCLQQQNTT